MGDVSGHFSGEGEVTMAQAYREPGSRRGASAVLLLGSVVFLADIFLSDIGGGASIAAFMFLIIGLTLVLARARPSLTNATMMA
jgi:hypothetical protein